MSLCRRDILFFKPILYFTHDHCTTMVLFCNIHVQIVATLCLYQIFNFYSLGCFASFASKFNTIFLRRLVFCRLTLQV